MKTDKLFNEILTIHNEMEMSIRIYLRDKEKKDVDKEKLGGMMTIFKRTGKELALINADFKCEKTGETENLQYHHLVERKNKIVLPMWRYLCQRNYWANISILTQLAHIKTHSEEQTIQKTTISKLKEALKDNLKYNQKGVELNKGICSQAR